MARQISTVQITAIALASAATLGITAAAAWSVMRPKTIQEQFRDSQASIAKQRAETASQQVLTIAGSKWWTKPQSTKDVEAKVAQIMELSSGDVVWIDNTGLVVANRESAYQNIRRESEWRLRPAEGIDYDHNVYFRVGLHELSREEAISRIAEHIARAEKRM